MDRLDEMGLAGPEIRVVGGGARSALWMQIKADVTARPVRAVLTKEPTALGAETMKARMGNKELAWMFENCFPNTLDTTVDFEVINGRPDTYVITGDIDAMWLRDSTAQVWPYLPLMKNDSNLQQLIAGVINRQTRCILKDPYANAFYKDENKVSHWKSDNTEMKPGVHERKWEIDSLCYPIRLAYHYWKATNDRAPLDAQWREAILKTLQTFQEQQRKTGPGPYRFQRRTEVQADTLAGGGYGHPAKPVGTHLLHVPAQRRRDGLPVPGPGEFLCRR